MTDQAAARRMRILTELQEDGASKDLAAYAEQFAVDERTIRRDVDSLQDVLGVVQGIELRRGRVYGTRAGFAPGYFTNQLKQSQESKIAIARAVVGTLGENLAIALTAGSTIYYVAREIRRAFIEEQRPENLIAFTNSLPALMELIAGGVSTGVIGEVYNPDDCAFHSHEFRSAFQPSVAIVGASGVVANPGAGTLELFSHRAEEAAFLKQLLSPIPEILVAVDASKIGRRHPWSFTSGGILTGKSVRLFTNSLTDPQREILDNLTVSAPRTGCTFLYDEAQ